MNEEIINQLLQELKQEWSYPNGFFVKARFGTMDNDGYDRVISVLERMDVALAPFQDEKTLDRNLVLSLWHIPLFMEWQRKRIYEVSEQNVSKHWSNWHIKVINIIYKIFGYDGEEAYQKLKNSQEALREERERESLKSFDEYIE